MRIDLTRRDSMATGLAALAVSSTSIAGVTDETIRTSHMTDIESYMAVALQFRPQSVNALGQAEARAAMLASIARMGTMLTPVRGFIEQYSGSALKLIVLPEYFLSSYPTRDSISGWAEKAALAPDGPEYQALGKIAQDKKIFLSGNVYETDKHFPRLYFQASFLIAPNGNVVLRYRRLNSMYAPTPHDVWEKYLDIYGLDGVFPVAKTEIGRISAIASEEILYPEIARCHVLRGAEILLHSSSEIGSPLPTQKHIARRARAFENLAYVISANTAGIAGNGLPEASADGNSAVIDYKGTVLAESNAGETFTAFGEIDLAALRRARHKPGMTNYLARQRSDLFAQIYATMGTHSANGLIENGTVKIPDRDYFVRRQQEIIARLDKAGII
jgi:predicted amidohydrolase